MNEVGRFLDELASAQPVPGGGSVAALETAMGAALLEMVANLTIGKKRYADVQSEVEGIRDSALDLRRRAERLAEDDAGAYGLVSDALSLPRETEDQKAQRRERVQEALKGAAEPPLDTMRAAREVVLLADRLVDIGNSSAVSDVGSAAVSAQAAFQAARLNVEINVAAVRDEAWVAEMCDRRAGIPDVAELVASVLRRVEATIRGESG